MNQRPAFKIKLWERPQLEKLAATSIPLLRRYSLIDEPIRTATAIRRAEEEFFGARAGAKRVEKRYGKATLAPHTDFEWGMLNGKLSALRWVLGWPLDMLDT